MTTFKLPSLDVTQEQVKELLKELTVFVEKEEDNWFKPKIGEIYFFIEDNKTCGFYTHEDHYEDIYVLDTQRVYRTKIECEEAIKINQARIQKDKKSHKEEI